ncbi:DUF1003 domain-containing protein [Roseomonas sp. CCTCC AB2023176]|uniref:DUF1003 domain-containing protein n=1 Tax=Roseomonas sp. CCTCC AB2023176 TaxID=3342640 RepID=UPI0035DEC832
MSELDAGPDAATTKRQRCAITGEERSRRDLLPLDSLRPGLIELIRHDHPDLADDAQIGRSTVNEYRSRYVEDLLRAEHGEFTELDRQVTESIARQDTIAANTEDEFEEKRSFGQRVSDGLASFGGSWAFLISFAAFLGGWIGIALLGGQQGFDPYPFILLNLVLSTIAAIQAPIIMMSQNRQEAKDRLRSFNDYRVNLKAELEVRHLHEKLDYLATKQWQRMMDIQRLQIELLQEARRR